MNYWKLFSLFSDAQSMMPEASSKVARSIFLTYSTILRRDSFQGAVRAVAGIIVQRP
jgi:hypothetical protein